MKIKSLSLDESLNQSVVILGKIILLLMKPVSQNWFHYNFLIFNWSKEMIAQFVCQFLLPFRITFDEVWVTVL